MKRILVTGLFCLSLLVTFSCSEESDTATANDRSGQLEGTWQVASYLVSGRTTTLVFDEPTTRQFEGIGADFNAYNYVFSEDGSFDVSGTYIFTLRVTDEDGQTTTQGSQVSVNQNGNWMRNGNRITITDQEETYDIVITLLTDTRLEFIRNISEDVIIQENSSSTTTSGTEEFILFRVGQ